MLIRSVVTPLPTRFLPARNISSAVATLGVSAVLGVLGALGGAGTAVAQTPSAITRAETLRLPEPQDLAARSAFHTYETETQWLANHVKNKPRLNVSVEINSDTGETKVTEKIRIDSPFNEITGTRSHEATLIKTVTLSSSGDLRLVLDYQHAWDKKNNYTLEKQFKINKTSGFFESMQVACNFTYGTKSEIPPLKLDDYLDHILMNPFNGLSNDVSFRIDCRGKSNANFNNATLPLTLEPWRMPEVKDASVYKYIVSGPYFCPPGDYLYNCDLNWIQKATTLPSSMTININGVATISETRVFESEETGRKTVFEVSVSFNGNGKSNVYLRIGTLEACGNITVTNHHFENVDNKVSASSKVTYTRKETELRILRDEEDHLSGKREQYLTTLNEKGPTHRARTNYVQNGIIGAMLQWSSVKIVGPIETQPWKSP